MPPKWPVNVTGVPDVKNTQLMAYDATLHDYFATAALQGILSTEVSGDGLTPPFPGEGETYGERRRLWLGMIAREAYGLADTMLEQREK